MRKRKIFTVVAALSAGSLLVAACGSDESDSTGTTSATTEAPTTTAAEGAKDIVDTAIAAGSFTTLADLLTKAGLVDTLRGEGPFTVFAPTDEAFAKVDKATLDALAADTDALTRVLTYHVVPGKVMAADVKPGKVKTVEGSEATISVEGGTVKIDGATVVTTDVMASNGVIHVIDSVILPPDLEIGGGESAAGGNTIVDVAVGAGSFTTLVEAVKAAGLVETLSGEGPFTVFAPTDEAFSRVPAATLEALLADKAGLTKVLTYHVVAGKVMAADVKPGTVKTVEGTDITITQQGSDLFVNGAKIVATDVMASNGVIHVIDAVLLPTVG